MEKPGPEISVSKPFGYLQMNPATSEEPGAVVDAQGGIVLLGLPVPDLHLGVPRKKRT